MSHTQKIIFSELKHRVGRCARYVIFLAICEKLRNFCGNGEQGYKYNKEIFQSIVEESQFFPLLQEKEIKKEEYVGFFCFHIDPAE